MVQIVHNLNNTSVCHACAMRDILVMSLHTGGYLNGTHMYMHTQHMHTHTLHTNVLLYIAIEVAIHMFNCCSTHVH